MIKRVEQVFHITNQTHGETGARLWNSWAFIAQEYWNVSRTFSNIFILALLVSKRPHRFLLEFEVRRIGYCDIKQPYGNGLEFLYAISAKKYVFLE